MGYQFKLEALRRYRQFEEDRLQKALSDARRLLEQAEAVLAGRIEQRSRCEDEFRLGLQNGGSASKAAMYRRFLQTLTDEIDARRSEVQSAKRVCEQAREALLVAMKKRKTLDRLKEKGEQAFLAELDSAEQKFINEMAINRFTLRNN
ncbi:MAG: flagellar export protein FliJ [Desulfobacteraceae bacterium]|nr:MAG: flagellar export protein FliJ [Desulfobacteraceae bacterium]